MNLSVSQIASYIGGLCNDAALKLDIEEQRGTRVIIDSRLASPGAVFFAFKGEKVEGESYVAKAIQEGALVAVVSEAYASNLEPVIRVKNVEWALQELSKVYFASLNPQPKVVAISGSVGKTSTKDMIAHVLSKQYKVFKTKGNFNNEIGVPLMLMEIDSTYDVAVLELGMNHYGELSRLAQLTQHNLAVLTNIGTAHIEFFGSRSGIFAAKMEIAESLDHEGVLIVNGHDDLLSSVHSDQYRVVKTGSEHGQLWADNIRISLEGTFFDLYSHLNKDGSLPTFMPLFGEHQVQNALLSAAVAQELNMGIESVVEALRDVEATRMRFQLQHIQKRIWINDAYNASQDSIIAACKTFTLLPVDKRWLVLGDIFECGDLTQSIHEKLGSELSPFCDRLDYCVFIGEASKFTYQNYRGHGSYFESKADAIEFMTRNLPEEACVLVKASRGMKLEEIVFHFTELARE